LFWRYWADQHREAFLWGLNHVRYKSKCVRLGCSVAVSEWTVMTELLLVVLICLILYVCRGMQGLKTWSLVYLVYGGACTDHLKFISFYRAHAIWNALSCREYIDHNLNMLLLDMSFNVSGNVWGKLSRVQITPVVGRLEEGLDD
jgi:hypothetical protein